MRFVKEPKIVIILVLAILAGPASVAGDSPGAIVDRFHGAYRSASLEGMLANVRAHLAPAVIGENPLDISRLNAKLRAALPSHWFSHSGVEMALWDLCGQAAGRPVIASRGICTGTWLSRPTRPCARARTPDTS